MAMSLLTCSEVNTKGSSPLSPVPKPTMVIMRLLSRKVTDDTEAICPKRFNHPTGQQVGLKTAVSMDPFTALGGFYDRAWALRPGDLTFVFGSARLKTLLAVIFEPTLGTAAATRP